MTGLAKFNESNIEKFIEEQFQGGGGSSPISILRIKNGKIIEIGDETIEYDKIQNLRLVFKTNTWQVSSKTGDDFKTIIRTSEIYKGKPKARIFDMENEEYIEVNSNAKEINQYIQNLLDVRPQNENEKIDKKFIEVVYLYDEETKKLYKMYLKLSQSAGGEYIGKGAEKKFKYKLDNPMEGSLRAIEKKGNITRKIFTIIPAEYRLGSVIVDYPKFEIQEDDKPINTQELLEVVKGIVTIIETSETNSINEMNKDEEENF